MTEEDEAFEELSRKQGDWGMQGSRKHQIMRYAENVENKGTSMTDKEAMAMAFFALDIVKIHYTQSCHINEAITALKERLAQPEQEPVYHLRQYGDVTKEQLEQYIETGDINPPATQPAVPDFKAFKAWANDAGYDTAYTHDGIKWVCLNPMTADLWKAWQAATPPAQPAQRTEPIQSLQCFHCQDTIETLNDKVMHLLAQRTEQNFCPRCGKRTNDIHTCTPPKD
jgi:hypothetical protein